MPRNADPSNVRFLVLDVDGVLTDGRIVLDNLGHELKFFDVQDGLGIRLWMKAGHEIAILTGRTSQIVAIRARELGIKQVIQGSKDKAADFQRLLDVVGVPAEEAAVVGDDLPDLPCLRRAGYPVAVANAVNEVKHAAAYVTDHSGGRGAVREVIEHVLKARNEWDRVCRRFQSG